VQVIVLLVLKRVILQRGNPNATMEYQQRLANLWQKYDCNPFKSMLGILAQAPLFIGFFSALRALAAAKVRLLLQSLSTLLRSFTQPQGIQRPPAAV